MRPAAHAVATAHIVSGCSKEFDVFPFPAEGTMQTTEGGGKSPYKACIGCMKGVSLLQSVPMCGRRPRKLSIEAALEATGLDDAASCV